MYYYAAYYANTYTTNTEIHYTHCTNIIPNTINWRAARRRPWLVVRPSVLYTRMCVCV